MLKDRPGQMMLINAFLLAITVVVITLMLNNVIYSSNVAYEGFMDQSRYDDLSYRAAMADEAAYAYTNDSGNYTQHLGDFGQSLNNLMLLKGRYISISPQSSSIPPGDNTWTKLYIYGKDSSSSYNIYTMPPSPGVYGNGSGYGSGHTAPSFITLAASKKILVSNGTDEVLLTVTVLDNQSNPMSNVAVHMDKNRTTSGFIGLDGSLSGGGTTDFLGQFHVYLIDVGQNASGDVSVYASMNSTNSTINSIPVVITCISPNPTMTGYDIPAPAVSLVPTEQVPVTVSFDFTSFINANVYIFSNESYNNLALYGTNPVYNPTTHNISFTLKRVDDYAPGNMTMWARVTGYCTLDNRSLDEVKQINITVPPMSSGNVPYTVSLSGVNNSNNKVDAAIAFNFAGFDDGKVQVLNNAMYGTTFNNTAYTNNNEAAFDPATDTIDFQVTRNDKNLPGSVTLWCEATAVDAATGMYYDHIYQITADIPAS